LLATIVAVAVMEPESDWQVPATRVMIPAIMRVTSVPEMGDD
jgi:hypothetical protein